MMLAGADDLRIVAEADDGDKVGPLVAEHTPDVVLMDIRMPRVDGLTATEQIRGRDGAPEIIILTTFDADEHVVRALRAGSCSRTPRRPRSSTRSARWPRASRSSRPASRAG